VEVARFDTSIRPSLTRGRTSFSYEGNLARIPEGAAPDTKNKSFTITAQVDVAKALGEGVIVTQGGLFGGWALYVEKGGLATLKVDGEKVAEGRVERTLGYRISIDESFDVGEDSGTPVSQTYDVPFRFTGRLDKVTIDLGEIAKADREAVESAEKLARLRKGGRD